MKIQNEPSKSNASRISVKQRSDELMNYFLICFYLAGFVFAFFYNTFFIAFTVGTLCLVAYYSAKFFLPEKNLYQYVLSAVLGVFMAQYIYQMHGLFEMHFFAFIGSALLITYQNCKLQLPLMLVVLIHHATFGYLQNAGYSGIYFTQLDYFEVQTFIIHILLAGMIFFISGLWSYQLRKYNELFTQQSVQMALLQRDAEINREREENAKALEEAYLTAEKARKEAEAANENAQQANLDLEMKNKELEEFSYIASHDLQEPLRTVSSFIGLLQKHFNAHIDDKATKYFDFILDGTERMKSLIKSLLEYSRIGKKKELKEVDCFAVLQNVIADLNVAIEESNAIITIDPLPVIYGYQTEIKQLFQNLIINAIKFRKKDAVPHITISCKKINNGWEFMVKDNGIGIEEKYLEKIFTIFQRLHTRDEYEGSGIGLSYCKKIAELHKGKIWVTSTPEAGSNFYFTIKENLAA